MSNKKQQRINKAATRATGANVIDVSATAANMATAAMAPAVVDRPAAWAAAWEVNRMFGPGIPNRPAYDTDDGARIFDYMAGVNLYITPRSGYGLMPFTMLRNFADLCEEVRIVIEAFKREIRSMEWDIVKTIPGDKTDYGTEARRLKAFWQTPDGVTEFDAWLNAVLEDMLVTDAVTLWLEGDGRNITAVQQIDGATIRPLLDGRGRIPTAPIPGYMQAIKGMNWTWFTSEFLLYRPFNTSVVSPYGKSPIEYIITTINTSLLRKLSAVKYWDQTNVPEALVGLPDSMPLESVTAFQDYFDTLLAGNVDKLRRIKFMPVQSGSMPVHEFRRPDGSTVADEWMLKMASWAFGFLPSEFGIVNGAGLGGAGFLEGQENTMYRFGVGPVIQYIQNLITTIVQRQTAAPLGFRFVNVGPNEDKKIAAELDDMQLRNGVIDINVLREKAGQKPYPGAEPFLLVGNTPILLRDLFAPKPEPVAPVVVVRPDPKALAGGHDEDPDEDEAEDAEVIDGAIIKMALDQWRQKCRRRVGDGKAALCDPPTIAAGSIPAAVASAIKAVLATGPGSIEKAFSANTLEAVATAMDGGALAMVKKKSYP